MPIEFNPGRRQRFPWWGWAAAAVGGFMTGFVIGYALHGVLACLL